MKNSILVAVGGNSLIRAGQRGTIAEQLENAKLTSEHLAEIVARGYSLVITHGNGPQVGAQLLRSEIASSQTYTLPLDTCVAMTQGEIGFALQSNLQMSLRKRGINRSVVTIITQVVVDRNDPAFERPTKPIGPFYSKETAEHKRKNLKWSILEDSARGYRRVVASPQPKDILELNVIKKCLEQNFIVIAAGGGGVPVIVQKDEIKGIEAVIDKDKVSALLAAKLGIEYFIISTEVPAVYINYKMPNQKMLKDVTVAEIKKYIAEHHFYEGSMLPKIESAIDFLSNGGKLVIITNPENIIRALEGDAGTRIHI